MTSTKNRGELLNEAIELADFIKESELFNHYVFCYNKLQANEGAQKKMAAFIHIKEKYEEVQRFGSYHPEYERVGKRVRQVKREMDLEEDVAEFKRAEQDLQSLLDVVSVTIGRSVSEHVKVPVGDPFFEQGCTCKNNCHSSEGAHCHK